jgi:acyl carrier protein
MIKKQVKRRIAEFARTYKAAKNDETKLLLVALFVEDAFGIVLSDDDIHEKNFGTHHAIENFVLEKLHLE